MCSGHACAYAKKHFDIEAHVYEYIGKKFGRERPQSFRIDETEALLRQIQEDIQKYFDKQQG